VFKEDVIRDVLSRQVEEGATQLQTWHLTVIEIQISFLAIFSYNSPLFDSPESFRIHV
jgi:hypothetical protein